MPEDIKEPEEAGTPEVDKEETSGEKEEPEKEEE